MGLLRAGWDGCLAACMAGPAPSCRAPGLHTINNTQRDKSQMCLELVGKGGVVHAGHQGARSPFLATAPRGGGPGDPGEPSGPGAHRTAGVQGWWDQRRRTGCLRCGARGPLEEFPTWAIPNILAGLGVEWEGWRQRRVGFRPGQWGVREPTEPPEHQPWDPHIPGRNVLPLLQQRTRALPEGPSFFFFVVAGVCI